MFRISRFFSLYFLFRGRFARFDLRTLGKRGLQLFLPGLRRGVLPGQLVLLGLQRLFPAQQPPAYSGR